MRMGSIHPCTHACMVVRKAMRHPKAGQRLRHPAFIALAPACADGWVGAQVAASRYLATWRPEADVKRPTDR